MLNRIVNKTLLNPTLMPQFSHIQVIPSIKPSISQLINKINIDPRRMTALVTGSNRGLGLEMTKQLLEKKYNVLALCFEVSKELYEDLWEEYPDRLSLIPSDARKPQQISQLKEIIKDTPIDLCFLNAGILGKNGQGKQFGELDFEDLMETYSINTAHPILLAQTLYENVASSDRKQFIGITSATSSIKNSQNRTNDLQWLPYRMSKTALNMAFQGIKTKSDHEHNEVHCMVLHPGTCKTKMTGSSAQLEPTESIAGILEVAENKELYENGGFYDYQGNQLPW